ncbi:MAG: hypothetical protein SVV67_03485 [Bacillota bacterium]|nr:hypothetical protein [Bacillota bacterium]
MDTRKVVMVGLLILLLVMVSCGCGEEKVVPEEDEISGQAEEEIETTIVPDDETAEDETEDSEGPSEEPREVETDSDEQSGTTPHPGTVFKHEVKMNIDGVVEKDLNEGWWEEP